MSEKQTSYRQIMKATSLFGGLQIFNIIITIIRSKFIAVLLGPAGMGIAGLLTSTIGLIGSITGFGLGSSAVKNVAASNTTSNSFKIATTVSVLRRLVWITGLLGTLVTIVLSPWLSQLTFGNKDYTLAFAFLSITLLLTQLSTGQLTLLQGMRKLKYLAKADLTGILMGLLISVPIYYTWGIQGIVPAIIVSSIFTLFFSWFFASKVKIETIHVNKTMLQTEGLDMLRLGIMLSMSGFITLGASYIVRIYISHTGGVDQVGLYNAGFSIINTYVGMIFTAMATDYYPRLAGVSHDDVKSKNVINQQGEIAILIIAPVLTCFLVYINWAILLLYSNKFLGVNEMIHWAALGMFFKASSWSVSFILLVKSSRNLFFWNEFIANIYVLLLNIIGYKLFGLTGLGISFLVGYFLYFLQVYIIAKTKYSFEFENSFYKIFAIQFLLGLACFIAVKIIPTPWSYITGTGMIFLSSAYSIWQLASRIGLKSLMNKLINKDRLK
jgi:O-antigen/teichoic acid export membrane protein